MKIICTGCSGEYNVDDDRIPTEGMKATCPKCMTSWVVQVATPSVQPAAPDPGPVAAPVADPPAPESPPWTGQAASPPAPASAPSPTPASFVAPVSDHGGVEDAFDEDQDFIEINIFWSHDRVAQHTGGSISFMSRLNRTNWEIINTLKRTKTTTAIIFLGFKRN